MFYHKFLDRQLRLNTHSSWLLLKTIWHLQKSERDQDVVLAIKYIVYEHLPFRLRPFSNAVLFNKI